MKKELQEKLYSKYPSIFVQKDLPMDKTCMCWGISCGDGWIKLLDDLCAILVKLDPKVQAVQVKEKFGTLRFYINGSNSDAHTVIDWAEHMSEHICEACGNYGKLRDDGWLNTLCDKCWKEHKKLRKGKCQIKLHVI